eukprot:Selendium_serpulae@DN6002_c0_g1_i1.p1
MYTPVENTSPFFKCTRHHRPPYKGGGAPKGPCGNIPGLGGKPIPGRGGGKPLFGIMPMRPPIIIGGRIPIGGIIPCGGRIIGAPPRPPPIPGPIGTPGTNGLAAAFGSM